MRDFSAGTTCSPMIYQALRQKAAVAVRAMWGSGECVFLRTRPWGCDTPGKNAEVFHLCDLEPEVGKLYHDGCSAQAKSVADGAQPCTADPAASTGVDGHLHKKEDIEVDGAPLVLGFGEAFSHSRQQGADRKVDK